MPERYEIERSIHQMCESIHGRIDLHNKLDRRDYAICLYEEWYVDGTDPLEEPDFLAICSIDTEIQQEYVDIKQALPLPEDNNSQYKHLDFD